MLVYLLVCIVRLVYMRIDFKRKNIYMKIKDKLYGVFCFGVLCYC